MRSNLSAVWGNQSEYVPRPFDALGGLSFVGHEVAPDSVGTTRNLVLNGDAESGPSATAFSTVVTPQGPWSSEPNFTQVSYDVAGSPRNSTGGTGFFAGGPNNDSQQAFQQIDVSAFADAIDTGAVQYNAGVDLGGYGTQEDNMNMVVEFLDGTGLVLDGISFLGPTAAMRGNESSFWRWENTDTIPVGTRFIMITLVATRMGGGSYNDGYADNVYMSLTGEGIAGGIVQVTTNHDYHHEPLGIVTGVQFETTHSAATATFSADQLASLPPILGDDHADTLSILLGSVHSFAGGLAFQNWTPGVDKVIVTGTSGADVIYDNNVDDTIHTGGGNDNVSLSLGDDTVFGEGGDDTVYAMNGGFAGSFTAADKFDGGPGTDTLLLEGDYSTRLVLGDNSIKNVEHLVLVDGFDYNIVLADGNVANGATFTVEALSLGAAYSVTFDGSHEHNGKLVLLGGEGDDTLTGGAKQDVIFGSFGADRMAGRSGADIFAYDFVGESTSSLFDIINHFNAKADKIDITIIGVPFHGVDAPVTHGRLTAGNFDPNLMSAVGRHELHAHHAVLFSPSQGNYVGNTFLVIDMNGRAGYQADQDLVIEFTQPVHLSNFTAADIVA